MTATTAGRRWPGQLILRGGFGLYLGPAFETGLHAHHAVQICVSVQAPFRLRGARSRWRSYRGAVVAGDHRHQLDGAGTLLALLYLDPEGDAARALVGRGAPVRALPDAVVARLRPRLHRCAREPRPQALERVCEEMLEALAPRVAPAAPLDARIVRAIARFRELPERRARLADVAAAVGLSPSRFAHLFRAQTGLAMRPFLLWLRLGDALEELARGASLTEAAHAAAFADSAHLSRTARRMLGIVPSALKR